MSVFRFLSAFPAASARSAESSRASDARGEARAANREVAELRFQLDRLQMICEAMWTVVKQRVGVEDADLLALMEVIDLRDGRLDGRTRPVTAECSRCGKVVSVRTGVCLYCGLRQSEQSVF